MLRWTVRAKPIQINALAQQIQNEFTAAFVFGTEEGVIQQTAQKIARFIVPDLKDDLPFIEKYGEFIIHTIEDFLQK